MWYKKLLKTYINTMKNDGFKILQNLDLNL